MPSHRTMYVGVAGCALLLLLLMGRWDCGTSPPASPPTSSPTTVFPTRLGSTGGRAVAVNFTHLDDPVLEALWDHCESVHGGVKDFPGGASLRMLVASLPQVRTVCETGFAQGHSALLFLYANPDAHVYSFDWFKYGRAEKERCLKFVRATFPGRHHLIEGNSSVTVPRFRRLYPDVTCDLMAVDNSAITDRYSDMNFFRTIASCHNLVIHRISVPPGTPPATGVVPAARTEGWAAAVKAGFINEAFCGPVMAHRPTSGGAPATSSFECYGTYTVPRAECVLSRPMHRSPEVQSVLQRLEANKKQIVWAGKDRVPYRWSIGMYTASDPIRLLTPADARWLKARTKGSESFFSLMNPVLAPEDAWDVPSDFVADPLLLRHGDWWYLFFETLSAETWNGDISWAYSVDGSVWRYGGLALDEDFHLSFPTTFEWGGDVFMMPDTHGNDTVALYKAVEFPSKWELVKLYFTNTQARFGSTFVDHVVHMDDASGTVFLLTYPVAQPDTFRLFWMDASEFPYGSWVEHPKSPVTALAATGRDLNDRTSPPWTPRTCGHLVPHRNWLIRYAQWHGQKIFASKIEMTREDYRETPTSGSAEAEGLPVLGPSAGSGQELWRVEGVHTFDVMHQPTSTADHPQYLIAVDGRKPRNAPYI